MTPSIVPGAASNGVVNGAANKRRNSNEGFSTRAIHVGSEPDPETGAVVPPISLATTYKQDSIGIHKVLTRLTVLV